MNPVEIEDAIAQLVRQPFDADTFIWDLLRALGNKDTTITRLQSTGKNTTNKSDMGGVLQRNNIHAKICDKDEVTNTLIALRNSEATTRYKARFVLATDGDILEFEDLRDSAPIHCELADLPAHFGHLLPLAGIEDVQLIKESGVDVRATGHMNKLYVELRKHNPAWSTKERIPAMNHFMARLIFCFFAEDTQIFGASDGFSQTVLNAATRDGSDIHMVLQEVFLAMNTRHADRPAENVPAWARAFPYVNGGLFAGPTDAPHFSKHARSLFQHLGTLNWTEINPDIFGSMIQAIEDPEERGHLGMHYTSVSNILKVLNPLFLDELRQKIREAGDNSRKLLNIRKRIAKIRVFDPACGSGNFLVIAYKHLRTLEANINQKRGEPTRKSDIPLNNFRGIELRDFAAEIARLALVIAKYQADVQHLGQQSALTELLPLSSENWITCGNALRLDWKELCPPTGTKVRVIDTADDLFATPLEQPAIDFENEGGETYICGNPPYVGSSYQNSAQKEDMKALLHGQIKQYRALDYVTGWFWKAAHYGAADIAFVSTNSICQGQQVARLWPTIFDAGFSIHFAAKSFKWKNLAAHNAGVTVIIVGLSKKPPTETTLFEQDDDGQTTARYVQNINGYLEAGPDIVVEKRSVPLSELSVMDYGNKPTDGGNLLLSLLERNTLSEALLADQQHIIRRVYGSKEYIRGEERYCLWIRDEDLAAVQDIPAVKARIEGVREMRSKSAKKATQKAAAEAHRFMEIRQTGDERLIIVPRVSSENRPYLPVGVLPAGNIVTDLVFALYDAPLWNMALIASRLHLVWIGTVCGKLETRIRYSNTLGWHTFPVPPLTEKHKADLTAAAEEILLAREAHFPATIADLYDDATMPQNLRDAHERNDEIVERIFVGRRFKHDTERREELFKRYAEMVG